jgi:hypothetical protein
VDRWEAALEFSITSANGDSVKISAANWFLAMGKALPFFRVDLHVAGIITCTPTQPGCWSVVAQEGERSWMIRELAPALIVVASPSSQPMHDPTPLSSPPQATPRPAPNRLSSKLAMPTRSSLSPTDREDDDDDDDETMAEQLFELSMGIAAAEPDVACQMALELVLTFVDAEAGSVARGTINDPALTFVAATGPVGGSIIGRTVPFGTGLVGLAFDMGGTLLVNDAGSDSRHLQDLDRETGFHTMSVLCVPVMTSDSRSFGVIQLLNPPSRKFSDDDIEAVETIAQTLAATLATSFS